MIDSHYTANPNKSIEEYNPNIQNEHNVIREKQASFYIPNSPSVGRDVLMRLLCESATDETANYLYQLISKHIDVELATKKKFSWFTLADNSVIITDLYKAWQYVISLVLKYTAHVENITRKFELQAILLGYPYKIIRAGTKGVNSRGVTETVSNDHIHYRDDKRGFKPDDLIASVKMLETSEKTNAIHVLIECPLMHELLILTGSTAPIEGCNLFAYSQADGQTANHIRFANPIVINTFYATDSEYKEHMESKPEEFFNDLSYVLKYSNSVSLFEEIFKCSINPHKNNEKEVQVMKITKSEYDRLREEGEQCYQYSFVKHDEDVTEYYKEVADITDSLCFETPENVETYWVDTDTETFLDYECTRKSNEMYKIILESIGSFLRMYHPYYNSHVETEKFRLNKYLPLLTAPRPDPINRLEDELPDPKVDPTGKQINGFNNINKLFKNLWKYIGAIEEDAISKCRDCKETLRLVDNLNASHSINGFYIDEKWGFCYTRTFENRNNNYFIPSEGSFKCKFHYTIDKTTIFSGKATIIFKLNLNQPYTTIFRKINDYKQNASDSSVKSSVTGLYFYETQINQLFLNIPYRDSIMQFVSNFDFKDHHQYVTINRLPPDYIYDESKTILQPQYLDVYYSHDILSGDYIEDDSNLDIGKSLYAVVMYLQKYTSTENTTALRNIAIRTLRKLSQDKLFMQIPLLLLLKEEINYDPIHIITHKPFNDNEIRTIIALLYALGCNEHGYNKEEIERLNRRIIKLKGILLSIYDEEINDPTSRIGIGHYLKKSKNFFDDTKNGQFLQAIITQNVDKMPQTLEEFNKCRLETLIQYASNSTGPMFEIACVTFMLDFENGFYKQPDRQMTQELSDNLHKLLTKVASNERHICGLPWFSFSAGSVTNNMGVFKILCNGSKYSIKDTVLTAIQKLNTVHPYLSFIQCVNIFTHEVLTYEETGNQIHANVTMDSNGIIELLGFYKNADYSMKELLRFDQFGVDLFGEKYVQNSLLVSLKAKICSIIDTIHSCYSVPLSSNGYGYQFSQFASNINCMVMEWESVDGSKQHSIITNVPYQVLILTKHNLELFLNQEKSSQSNNKTIIPFNNEIIKSIERYCDDCKYLISSKDKIINMDNLDKYILGKVYTNEPFELDEEVEEIEKVEEPIAEPVTLQTTSVPNNTGKRNNGSNRRNKRKLTKKQRMENAATRNGNR